MKQRSVVFSSLMVLVLVLSFINPSTYTQASFEQKPLDNQEDWFVSSETVNVGHSYPINLFFIFENETAGLFFYPRLSLVTSMNLPFNFTTYLNQKIKRDTSEFGVQISNTDGNFTIGLNGTIIIDTPQTGPIFIDVIAEDYTSFANFPSLMGEDLTIPINFSPITFHVGDININGVEAISIVLAPQVYVQGSIHLNATVMGENLTWVTGEEIYFNEVSVEKDDSYFNTTIRNIDLIVKNITLSLESIATTIILHTTDFGDFHQNLLLNLTNIEWQEGAELFGDFFLFFLDNLFNLESVSLSLNIDSASFEFAATLMVMVIISSIVSFRRLRKSKR